MRAMAMGVGGAWRAAARSALLIALSASPLATPVRAGGGADPAAAFDRFKALEGEWVAAEDAAMVKKGDLVARYRLTGSGTALVEEEFPGTEHAMTTVYHRDGSDLVLTHYCMEGNQPRMRARATSSPTIRFAFDGGTNIDPRKDRFMHDAVFEFLGRDELKRTWNEWSAGKPTMTVTMHLVRRRDGTKEAR